MISMKISIALCTYNGEKFLNEQLESFERQTLPPGELIVCDDRSTDRTASILEDFARRASFLVRVYVNESNLGSTKNFEKAISLCTGDYIFLSDQDDVWAENKLEIFSTAFEEKQAGLVFSDVRAVDENLKELGYTSWEALNFDARQRREIERNDGLRVLLDRNVLTGCAMAFRSDLRELMLPIPTDIPIVIHDYWIALLAVAVAPVALISEPTVDYRQHSNQQIGSKIAAGAEQATAREAFGKIAAAPSFDERLHFYTPIRERLLAYRKKFPMLPAARAEIEHRFAHIVLRKSLQNGNLRKIPQIIGELKNSGYARYANGWKSAVKDLTASISKAIRGNNGK